MPTSARKRPFTATEIKALRLLKKRHRPRAVELALGLKHASIGALRQLARERGWEFPAVPRSCIPITEAEYVAACRDAGVEPNRDFGFEGRGDAAMEAAWPHLVEYPLPSAPRSQAAGEQAARVFKAVQHLRYVPASQAGGGERHFARECAEHLALLMAYAPGRGYPDDPRALVPERRIRPEVPAPCSYAGSSMAMVAELEVA